MAKETEWSLLDEEFNVLEKPENVSTELLVVIAEQVEALVTSGKKDEIASAAKKLADFFGKLLAAAPDGALHAATRSSRADSNTVAAYTLGHIGAAQQIAAQAAAHRVGSEFYVVIKNKLYSPIIAVLSIADLSNSEIASKIGIQEETVCRKLQKLRHLGISDTRREGTRIINSLTPAALDYLRVDRGAEKREGVDPKIQYIEKLRGDLPLYLQHSISLSGSDYLLPANDRVSDAARRLVN